MDEQRIQAYVALVDQLMWCSTEEEALAVLQQQGQLVGAGLLEIMVAETERLQSQGNANVAQRLQRLQQIASDLAEKNQGVATEEPLQEAAIIESLGNFEQFQFLRKVLKLIEESQGNAQQVYPLLAQHQDQLNEMLLQTLPQVAAELLVSNSERQLVAIVLDSFGTLIRQFPLGQRWLNLELSITAHHQVLSVTTQTAMPVGWAITMNNLALAYAERIRGDRAENLEQAIAAYHQALSVTTQFAMSREWAQTMNNLALAYKVRIRGDRAENLEQAIAAYHQALSVMTQSNMPMEWAITMNNLATAYKDRIRGDRAENLEQAIAAYHQVLTVMTQSNMPMEWAGTMNNLASAYAGRIRGDRAENLEQAIAAYHQVLMVMTQSNMPMEWAITMNNLASAYADRIRGNRAENLEQAIAACHQALSVRTQFAMPMEWAQTTMNLATAYADRIRGNQAENLEQAIAAYHQTLNVRTQTAMPVEWAGTMNNLATAYKNRIRGDRAENLEQAIAAYQSSLKIFEPEFFPKDCRRTSRNLGDLYSEQKRWTEAVPIYQKAIQSAEILYQSANLLDGKAAELAATADLPRRAAYAFARSGDIQAAALTLEQGRARGLSETLERDQFNLTQLQQTNPDLFTQYQDITAQVRNLEIQQRLRMTSEERHSLTPETFRSEALRLRQTLTKITEQIRQVEGYVDFLVQPDFNDIQQALRSGIPLVYLVPTPAGSLALIVTSNDITDLWLDDLTEASLLDLLKNTWFSAYNQSQTNRLAWLEAIDRGTRQLWEPLMAPLINYLQQRQIGQATLIPIGFLSLLPLHAAWTEDSTTPTGRRYALDAIHFTYAPNARSLNAAEDIAQRTEVDSILAIDNPLKDLPNSTLEVTAAVATFPQHKVLKHEEAAIESVLGTLPHYNILHLSCHGTANLNAPLKSGLLMSDGVLTLRDLLNLKLSEQGGVRLAILSACETGLTGIELADEAIGLPTGLLQAGVAGVIASLWAVSELSNMMLLTRFYDFWRKDNLEPDAALRQAQLWMRDTTSQQKAKYFKGTNPDLFQSVILLKPDYFAHPFYWAAFSYVSV